MIRSWTGISSKPVGWGSSPRSSFKIFVFTSFYSISKYWRTVEVNWVPIADFSLAYPSACFSIFRILMYSVKIYCKGRGRFVGGLIFLLVNYEKWGFYLITVSTAVDIDFLSLSLSIETFWIIYLCYFVIIFWIFSNRLSKKRINLKNLFTSLGTSIIFSAKS